MGEIFAAGMREDPGSVLLVPRQVMRDMQADNEAIARERDKLRAEVERLRVSSTDAGAWVHRQAELQAEVERLRAALAEMLESFTEPEDDNDILRRARAALVKPKE